MARRGRLGGYGGLGDRRGVELTPADDGREARRVLALNAGSSTLKASIVDGSAAGEGLADSPPAARPVAIDWGDDASRGADVDAGVAEAFQQVGLATAGSRASGVVAVAHRVVHGGARFTAPIRIDDAVLRAIDELARLAPLHNPIAADTIRAARARLPDIPHVAVFDTAFHATLPEVAHRYPVPLGWDAWGVRRYGFHGLSVQWSVELASRLLGKSATDLELVVAHLGNGCSVTAVRGGRSVATSMGMTPLEGLMMGTRAGSIDPGILVALLRDRRLPLDELAETLDHGSGLLGVSGSSSDMRELEAAASRGDPRARLAIEMFVDRAAAGIAACATALPRLDAVIFTGGIGEHAGSVRAAIVDRLGVLGIEPIDAEETSQDRVMGTPGRGPAVLRIEAREDLIAAREAMSVIG